MGYRAVLFSLLVDMQLGWVVEICGEWDQRLYCSVLKLAEVACREWE